MSGAWGFCVRICRIGEFSYTETNYSSGGSSSITGDGSGSIYVENDTPTKLRITTSQTQNKN